MARGRIASKTKKKLNFLCYGDTFSGKSTFVSQFAYMHNEDGSPMKILYIDAESGSIDLYLDEMEENGVDLRNIFILYTQSLGEVLDYIEKVKNREEFYELNEDGEETDEIVLDSEGKPFFPDAIVIDGVTVLHQAVQQGLVEFSKKRARVRAENNGLIGDEKLVSIEGAGLEIRDYGAIKYKASNLCLALLGTGVHSAITCRQEDEKETRLGSNNQFSSVPTGKKIPSGFKGIDYNMHTVVRFFRNEDNEVCAEVLKDRTGVHPNEVLNDPSLLDWQVIIDGNVGRKDFVLKNSLDTAVETEQEIYSAEVMSNATKSMSKSDMEKAKVATTQSVAPTAGKADELRAAINAELKKLAPPAKKTMKTKIEAAGLPTDLKTITDAEVLSQILALVTE